MATRKLWSSAQSRVGKRPLRVDTLLKKEKEGTLYKLSNIPMPMAGPKTTPPIPSATSPHVSTTAKVKSPQSFVQPPSPAKPMSVGAKMPGQLQPPTIPSAIEKSASINSMFNELVRLGVTDTHLLKSAETKAEVKETIGRFKRLKESTPTAGQLLRGAAVGSVVAPAGTLIHNLIAKKDLFRGDKRLTPRAWLARAAQGAIFGGLLPYGRHTLEKYVERGHLSSALKTPAGKAMKTEIKKTLKGS